MFEIYLNQSKDMDLFSDKVATTVITKNSGKICSKMSIYAKFSFCKRCCFKESERMSQTRALQLKVPGSSDPALVRAMLSSDGN